MSGLSAQVGVTDSEPIDRLTVNTLGGNDTVDATGLDAGVIGLTVNLGDGQASGTLVDAGFEAPAVGSGFQYDPAGTPWTYTGSAGVAGNGSGFTAGNPNAPEGAQVAFLQQTGSFSQTVAGLAGGTYQLSFQAAQRGNFQASRQNFRVLVDGVAVGFFTPAGTAYSALGTTLHGRRRGAHDHLPGAGRPRRRQHRLHRQRPVGPGHRGRVCR